MTKETKKRILRRLEGKRNYEDVLRENIIKLVKEHKEGCKGRDNCDISLFLVRGLLTGEYKIELTDEEEKIFM